jgi:hypothetical protein
MTVFCRLEIWNLTSRHEIVVWLILHGKCAEEFCSYLLFHNYFKIYALWCTFCFLLLISTWRSCCHPSGQNSDIGRDFIAFITAVQLYPSALAVLFSPRVSLLPCFHLHLYLLEHCIVMPLTMYIVYQFLSRDTLMIRHWTSILVPEWDLAGSPILTVILELTYSMVQYICKADIHIACQTTAWFFMETEGSLPCSQKPTTGRYLEPAGFSNCI